MPRPRSAKALQADMHRNQMRWFLGRIDARAKAIETAATGVDREQKLWEFVGAVSHASEEMRRHLDSLEQLAK